MVAFTKTVKRFVSRRMASRRRGHALATGRRAAGRVSRSLHFAIMFCSATRVARFAWHRFLCRRFRFLALMIMRARWMVSIFKRGFTTRTFRLPPGDALQDFSTFRLPTMPFNLSSRRSVLRAIYNYRRLPSFQRVVDECGTFQARRCEVNT